MNETNRVEMEFVNELDPSLIKAAREKGGVWVDIIKQFINDENAKNVVLTFKNEADRKMCKSCLHAYKKKHNLDIVFGNYGPGIKIYISKA